MEYNIGDISSLENDSYLTRNKVRKISNNFELYYDAARFGINNDRRTMAEANYKEMLTTYNELKEVNNENTSILEKKIKEIHDKINIEGQLKL